MKNPTAMLCWLEVGCVGLERLGGANTPLQCSMLRFASTDFWSWCVLYFPLASWFVWFFSVPSIVQVDVVLVSCLGYTTKWHCLSSTWFKIWPYEYCYNKSREVRNHHVATFERHWQSSQLFSPSQQCCKDQFTFGPGPLQYIHVTWAMSQLKSGNESPEFNTIHSSQLPTAQ